MAYDIPSDVSSRNWRRANARTVQLDADVARIFHDASQVNNALRKLIEALPVRNRKRKSA